jgi:hypothetical protein
MKSPDAGACIYRSVPYLLFFVRLGYLNKDGNIMSVGCEGGFCWGEGEIELMNGGWRLERWIGARPFCGRLLPTRE